MGNITWASLALLDSDLSASGHWAPLASLDSEPIAELVKISVPAFVKLYFADDLATQSELQAYVLSSWHTGT